MVGTETAGEGSVGTAEDESHSHPLKLLPGTLVTMRNPFKFRQQSITIRDPRLEVVLPLLHKECQTLSMWYRTSSPDPTQKQDVEHGVKSILQTLGAGILQHICMAFTCGHSCIDYHGQLNPGSILREITKLQMKLDTTESGAEQRALVDDITGMILWFCWHAICLEVHQLLSEILKYIRKTGEVYGLLKIGQMIERAGIHPDLDGDQAYLQRIIADARAGASRHQLWLAASAAPSVDVRGVAISRDKPFRNTKETDLGTSPQVSSTPVVL